MPADKIIEKKTGSEVNQTPAVSVIIPAYKVADFIADTLASIFAQTYRNYEIILVNDGSPDTPEFEKVIEKYLEKIVYLKQENGGTASARNAGIECARGEFLAFLDGDDIWLAGYLQSQLAALAAKNCDLIYCDAQLFGGVRGENETFMTRSKSRGAVTAESLIDGNCSVITSGAVAKREKIVRAKMFDETLPRIGMEDFDLWFRLVKSGAKLDYQTKVLLKYRVRPNSLSGSNVQRAEREIMALNVISKKYDLSVSEKTALEKQRAKAVAELEIERGKLNLAEGNYAAARANFRAANRYYRKPKFTVLTALLQINPRITKKLYRALRPAEFSFVAPTERAEKND